MGRSREPALGARPVPSWCRGAGPDPELVRELYVQQGRTERQIAVDLSVSRDRVAAALAVAGIPRRTSRRPCPVTPVELGKLLDDDGTPRALARRFGVSPDTVRRWLAEAGLLAPDPDIDPARLRQLYLEERLTTSEVAAELRVPRGRVQRALAGAGIPTRPGTERRPRGNQVGVTDDALRAVYPQPGMNVKKTAAHFGVSDRYLRRRLHDLGLVKRSGNHTPQLPPDTARQLTDRGPALYQAGWSMHQVATELGVSVSTVRRALHHAGVPVRRSGPPRRNPIEPTPLLQALYDDPDITAILARHGVRRPGPKWRPSTPFESYAPLPLHPGLLKALYLDIGLAVDHIEMLCGVGAVTVRTALAQADIPTRAYGQPCPWNQRRHTTPDPPRLEPPQAQRP